MSAGRARMSAGRALMSAGRACMSAGRARMSAGIIIWLMINSSRYAFFLNVYLHVSPVMRK